MTLPLRVVRSTPFSLLPLKGFMVCSMICSRVSLPFTNSLGAVAPLAPAHTPVPSKSRHQHAANLAIEFIVVLTEGLGQVKEILLSVRRVRLPARQLAALIPIAHHRDSF